MPDTLTDRFGRSISYLRISVTDRCDFRCVYCMAEDMEFLPRKEVLSLEELFQVSAAFVELGVKKVRITGGEPLIRKNILDLFQRVGTFPGLQELCVTTNGSHLESMAQPLVDAGVNRINISLDSLQAQRFKEITRHGDLHKVLRGIAAAQQAGIERIKINSVILKNRNADEVVNLVQYTLDHGLDISFIEEMPLGAVSSHNRYEEFVSSADLRHLLGHRWNLIPSTTNSGGPSRYWSIPGYASRIGFISPHSENFCASCNRVRVTAAGRLLLCLGNEHSVDLKTVLRQQANNPDALKEYIVGAMDLKPERHYFDLSAEPEIVRFMSATGG